VLVAHGACDPLSPEEPLQRFAEGLQAPGCTLRTYPGMRHEILNELGRAQVYEDIAVWLEKHTTAAPRAAENA